MEWEFRRWFYGLSNRLERRRAVHPIIVHITSALFEVLPTYVLWWTMEFMGFEICIDEYSAIRLIESVRQSCQRIKEKKASEIKRKK